MLPYVYIYGEPLAMYGVMALFGIAFSLAIALAKHKAFHLRRRDVLLVITFAVIGALVGGWLFSVIGNIIESSGAPDFWTAARWIQMLNAGSVFYGGLLGALGMAALWAKIGRIELKNVLNMGAYIGLAFQSIGRIGCYCAGCCYGIELADGAKFPVQLVEAGYCFAMLLAFLIVKPERRWPRVPLFPVYLTIYSVGRFCFEFLRGDANRGSLWIFSTSQWIALALVSLAVVWLWKSGVLSRLKRSSKHNVEENRLCE